MELDVATNRAIQHGQNGLSNSLRKGAVISNEETGNHLADHIPEYFEVFDARKPADRYVDDKLYLVIK